MESKYLIVKINLYLYHFNFILRFYDLTIGKEPEFNFQPEKYKYLMFGTYKIELLTNEGTYGNFFLFFVLFSLYILKRSLFKF